MDCGAFIPIVFFIADFGDGGAQKQCLLLAKAINEHSYFRVHVLAIRGGPREKFLVENDIPYKVLGLKSGFDPRAAIALKRYMDSVQATTVVSWLHSADVHSFLASMFASRLQWVMTERDSKYPDTLRYVFRAYAARFSNVIVANSRAGVSLWRNRLPNTLVEQVGNIVPRRTDKKNIQAGYDVVMVCRLEEQKNVVNAVEALIHFSQTNPDRRVAVIGDGSLRLQIEAMLSKSESKVKMLGYVENAAEVIANSSVLFSLSRHEGLPNVVLEALSAETIPVLSCIPEHIEIVGAQYPFLVSLSDSASEAGAAIESAFRDGAINAVKQLEPLIEDLTAEVITRKYAKILSTMKHGGR